MDVPVWIWVGFVAFVAVLLAIDLLVFHREAHEVSMREAAGWSVVWITLGVAFAGVIGLWSGGTHAGEYLAGYLLEKSLSIDNIFVFVLVMGYFSVPARLQHKVLFWGVFGALVFRAAFIAAGAALLDRFHWMLYLFGAFLVLTGLRMVLHKETEVHPEHNPALRLLRKVIPVSDNYEGDAFFVKRTVGERVRRVATPLLAVLVIIETTDILFAVDSIPAIFGVTRDTFLVFTSNAFAILGLRALYFLLAGMMGRFVHLKTGLALILVLVGVKMLVSEWWHAPVYVSLGGIAVIVAASIVASLLVTPDEGVPQLGEEAS
jgi:tellurite resistance protein TerC